MGVDHVRVRWAGNRQFVGWDGAGHGVVMDALPAYSGEGTGTRPLELFLCALAACTAMDVVSVMEKKREDLRDLEIEVTATQREDEFPKIYTQIELRYIAYGFGLKRSALDRAVELSEEKYCTVRGMLGPQVTIHASAEVRESRAAGLPAKEA
jgi:putative redox protein